MGVVPVKCGACSQVFTVDMRASDLPVRAAARPRRRQPQPRKLPAVLEAYNAFTKAEWARLKAVDPALSKDELRKQVGINWRTAPENPMTGDTGAAPAAAPAPAPAPTLAPVPAPAAPEPAPPGAAVAARAPAAAARRGMRKLKLGQRDCGGCGHAVDGSYDHRCTCGQLVHSGRFLCTEPTSLVVVERGDDGEHRETLFFCSEACRAAPVAR